MIHGRFRATLTTCISKKAYVEHEHLEATARHRTAESFFREPDVQQLCKWIPPKTSDIWQKVRLYAEERKKCKALGVSQKVQNLIVQKRIGAVLELFHDMGYRTDVWDGNC
eukprot:Skav204882  [mRNA]  locus=scaffold2602:167043:167375:+ [translate_table: standard]